MLLSLLPSMLLVCLIPRSISTSCRCLYGESCWPSQAEFADLASNLSVPLIHPLPPATACYPTSNPSGNCTAVNQGTLDGNWRSNQSGSMQNINFETYTFDNGTIGACYLNTTLGAPCTQGSVPDVGVDARFIGDVQHAVRFAAKHNLRLVIKNTGHDYLGRSTARGSFLLWTHNLKNITHNSDFVPDGAPSSETYDAMTLGAGVQWHEAYDAVQLVNRVLVGGVSAGGSVGAAGGWILGGGHSALSPHYGLGVDNVVQFNIVLSTGEFITANSHKHSDLFWALRGGGGGTYGVVTSVTYKTHALLPIVGAYFKVNLTNPSDASKLTAEFVRITPSLTDFGWGGYALLLADSISFFGISVNVTSAQANASIDPFFSFAKNLTSGGTDLVAYTSPFNSFYDWYTAYFTTGVEVGSNTEIGSRLIPREVAENNSEETAEVMLNVTNVSWNLVVGGAVSTADPSSAGLNPALRKAAAHVVFGEGWPEGASAAQIQALRDNVKANVRKVEALSPGSGSYFNEASLYEENPKTTFFGSHYSKLKQIKDSYDACGLFVVAEGVGSEDWDSSLNCRR